MLSEQLKKDHERLEEIVREDYAEVIAILGDGGYKRNVQFQYYDDIHLFGAHFPDPICRQQYLDSLERYTFNRLARRADINSTADALFEYLTQSNREQWDKQIEDSDEVGEGEKD